MARFEALGVSERMVTNAQADSQNLDKIAILEDNAQDLLNKAMESAKLSARGYYRILRVARTIADLDAVNTMQVVDKIQKTHLAEALSYRRVRLK